MDLRRMERIARSVAANKDGGGPDIDLVCFYDYDGSEGCFETLADDVYGLWWDGDGKTAEDIFFIRDYDALAEYFGDEEYSYWNEIAEMSDHEIAALIAETCTPKEISEACMEEISGRSDLEAWISDHRDDYHEGSDDVEDGVPDEWLWAIFPEKALDRAVADAKKCVLMPDLERIYEAIAHTRGELDECGLGLREPYRLARSRGYSKGDVAYVLYRADSLDDEHLIDKLLWDNPVYCRVDVNGESYFLSEMVHDAYEWDRKEALQKLEEALREEGRYGEEELREIMERVDEEMPEEPEE